MFYFLVLLSVGGVGAFHPLEYAFGFWKRIDQGFVGHVRYNGALQNDYLDPGLHFIPGAYAGATVEVFDVMEDDDCFGCGGASDQICPTSIEGTPWCVAVKLKNQVFAPNSVEVVRQQKRNYDKRMGQFMRSSIAEVVATKDNLWMRRATTLNEEVLAKFRQTVVDGWGEAFTAKIMFNSLSIESKECQDSGLVKQWDEQVKEEAARVTVVLKAKTEAAVHSKLQAAVDAAAVRDQASTVARNAREQADAQSVADVQSIRDASLVATTTAEAAAARILALQQLEAEESKAALVKTNPDAARHKEVLEGYKAVYNNAKHTIVVPAEGGGTLGLAGFGTVLKSVFGR
jgi:hypothetical protein